jgi:hypothetical protein
MLVSSLVQLPFRIHGEGHESAFEYQALFDCGATATFGSKSLFVDKLGFKPSGKYVTVKNGDGSSQLSMGSVKVTMSIGCNFKAVVTVQIINLDCFDFVIGLDMIKAYKMELRHDPFRVTAMAYSNLRGPSNASRAPRRVHLPICINSLRDDEGHDASHYLCDVQNFRAECAVQGIPEQEALVLVPDENDAFSYRQLLLQLSEMQDQVDADEVLDLLTKIVDVQLPERKGIVKDSKVAIDGASDSLEDSFRTRVINEFPSLCADSLPHDGPAARQLDGSPFRVKLRLKEGVKPQGRRPYRIPESYRPEMEKTIAKLLEFKLIEPSVLNRPSGHFIVSVVFLGYPCSGFLLGAISGADSLPFLLRRISD